MKIETRYANNPKDVKHYTTEQLRENFLVENLFVSGGVNTVYTHNDRMIAGGVVPVEAELSLDAGKELGVDYFLQRRELGIINIGGAGYVLLDGVRYDMNLRDGLYVGMGTKDIRFGSDVAYNPAKFYIVSVPAHCTYPTVKIDISKANAIPAGCAEECNKRTIYQYLHTNVLETCSLQMGMTVLEPGSVWNTMPAHLHDRRMEIYLYFNMDPSSIVMHFMGEKDETRHIAVKNEQAVISPSWSIHSGVGTKNYTFIWSMTGENQTYTDMDVITTTELM